jgi:hypothetical protein
MQNMDNGTRFLDFIVFRKVQIPPRYHDLEAEALAHAIVFVMIWKLS